MHTRHSSWWWDVPRCQVPAELRSGHAPFSSLTLPAARSSAAFRSPITQAHTPVPLSRLTHQHHAQLPEYRSFTPVSSLTCTAFTLTWFLITHTCHSPYIYLTLPSRGVWYRTSTDTQPRISRDLTLMRITDSTVLVCISYVDLLSSRLAYRLSSCLVRALPSVTRVLFAATAFLFSLVRSEVASA